MTFSIQDRLAQLRTNAPVNAIKPIGVSINSSEQLVLSYSSLELMNSCPRKFELYKIHPIESERDHSPALSLGSAVGVGYARYLELIALKGFDYYEAILDDVLLETWRAYYPPLEDNLRSISKAHNIVNALIETPFALDGVDDPADWKLAMFNGKPAAELSFCIQLTPNIVYVGYLDGVMYSPSTNTYRPLELKTSSLTNNLEVNFKNSAQGLAYALILDTITNNKQLDFIIHYRVAQLHRAKADAFRPTIHDFYFHKSIMDRLEWLIGLQLEVKRLHSYMETGMFPRHGSSCLNWMRPCQFYGLCNLTDNTSKPKNETKDYQFYFDLDVLVSEALELANRRQGVIDGKS